ncbi:MAG: NUDIX hydrolase [Minisyncoccia bacterium]
MSNEKEILEFGIKRENEERRDGGCGIIFDPETQLYAVGRDIDNKRMVRLFGGGFNPGEDEKEGTLREVIEESGLNDFLHIEKIDKVICHFHNNSKNVDRVAEATCFFMILKSKNLIDTRLEEHEKFILDWVNAEEILSCWFSINHNKDYDHWIYFLKKSVKRAKELGYDTTSIVENLDQK